MLALNDKDKTQEIDSDYLLILIYGEACASHSSEQESIKQMILAKINNLRQRAESAELELQNLKAILNSEA